jgi:hypothetical protein
LTNYNLFSILERNYILQEEQKPSSATVPLDADRQHQSSDPYAAERPQRYRSIVLPPDWYVVGKNKKKRSEHQVHGLISFQDLSKTISDRWKSADGEIKAYCNNIVKDQLVKYRMDQDEYKKKYGLEVFESQKKTYRKRSNSDAGKSSRKRELYEEDSMSSNSKNSYQDHAIMHQSPAQNFASQNYQNPSAGVFDTFPAASFNSAFGFLTGGYVPAGQTSFGFQDDGHYQSVAASSTPTVTNSEPASRPMSTGISMVGTLTDTDDSFNPSVYSTVATNSQSVAISSTPTVMDSKPAARQTSTGVSMVDTLADVLLGDTSESIMSTRTTDESVARNGDDELDELGVFIPVGGKVENKVNIDDL